MKHDWKTDGIINWPGHQTCSRCGESFDAPFDPLDSGKIEKFIAKQHRRTDCNGRKKNDNTPN